MKYNIDLFPDILEFIPIIKNSFIKNDLERFCDDKTLTLLAKFGRYLCEENSKYNLTAISDPEGIATLHFADSIIFEDLFPLNSKVIDIGCGAGFPSIPLAIVRTDLKITCMDATSKKIEFIRKFVSDNDIQNVNCYALRAEEAFNGENRNLFREKYDIATSRAVASLGVIAEISSGFVAIGGRIIALKGDNVSNELPNDCKSYNKLGISSPNIVTKTVKGQEDYNRTACIFNKIKTTPDNYPRLFTSIKNKPLF